MTNTFEVQLAQSAETFSIVFILTCKKKKERRKDKIQYIMPKIICKDE
jgi:hypothetical protein